LEQSLDATNIGLILLNADLVIRRFSKPATNFFHLISSDVGRPFNHIRAQFVCENLMPAIQDAADVGSSVSFRIEPTEQSPRTLLAEVRPYELTRGELGLSISIVDITKAQRREEALEIISDRLTAILEASNVAVWERSLDSTNIASMRDHRATQQALAEKGHVGSLEEVSYRVKEGDGYRTMSSRAAIGRRKDKPLMSGLVIDVTDDRAREMQLEALNDRLLQVNESLDDFNRVGNYSTIFSSMRTRAARAPPVSPTSSRSPKTSSPSSIPVMIWISRSTAMSSPSSPRASRWRRASAIWSPTRPSTTPDQTVGCRSPIGWRQTG